MFLRRVSAVESCVMGAVPDPYVDGCGTEY